MAPPELPMVFRNARYEQRIDALEGNLKRLSEAFAAIFGSLQVLHNQVYALSNFLQQQNEALPGERNPNVDARPH